MATYYVDGTNGNDTTGDGSLATPWRSLVKALASQGTGGNTVYIAPGDYLEITTAGTKEYLECNRNFTNYVEFVARDGPGTVTVHGSAGQSAIVVVSNCVKVRFRNITFSAAANVFRTSSNGAINGLELIGCTFVCSGAGTTFGVSLTPTTVTQTNILIDQCTFSGPNGIKATNTAGPVTSLTITNNAIDVTGTGMEIHSTGAVIAGNKVNGDTIGIKIGLVNLTVSATITGNSVRSLTSYGIIVGLDASGTCSNTVTVSGNDVGSRDSHAVLIGYGTVAGSSVYDNEIHGGDQGLVIKAADGVLAYRNQIDGGASLLSGLYLKGCTGCRAWANGVETPAGYCLRIGPDGATHADGNRVIGNYFHASGGTLLSTENYGSNVVDGNVYKVDGTAVWGDTRGTTVASLAEVRTAWVGYAVATNDGNSETASDRIDTLQAPTRARHSKLGPRGNRNRP